MNSCCTLYHIDPSDIVETKCISIEDECTDCRCQCGYIQFESLTPYMTKLSNTNTRDEDHINLEAKLRQQIVEVSRLFDLATKAEPGTYAKAHCKIIKLYGNGSRYLKIPEFVDGTLELYTANGYLINSDSYGYKDGFLIQYPCENHGAACGCTNDCGNYPKQILGPAWNGCFQAKAQFGKECADSAVQLAIKSYIIEYNTYGDVKETNFQGLPISRGFKVPHSWQVAVDKYLERKRQFNSFGFA